MKQTKEHQGNCLCKYCNKRVLEQGKAQAIGQVLEIIDKKDWWVMSYGRSTDWIEEIQFKDSIEQLKQKLEKLNG